MGHYTRALYVNTSPFPYDDFCLTPAAVKFCLIHSRMEFKGCRLGDPICHNVCCTFRAGTMSKERQMRPIFSRQINFLSTHPVQAALFGCDSSIPTCANFKIGRHLSAIPISFSVLSSSFTLLHTATIIPLEVKLSFLPDRTNEPASPLTQPPTPLYRNATDRDSTSSTSPTTSIIVWSGRTLTHCSVTANQLKV